MRVLSFCVTSFSGDQSDLCAHPEMLTILNGRVERLGSVIINIIILIWSWPEHLREGSVLAKAPAN